MSLLEGPQAVGGHRDTRCHRPDMTQEVRGVRAEHRLVGELVTRSPTARSERVAALDDKAGFDPVELQAIVEMVVREEDEVVHGLRRQLGIEEKGDGALGRLHRDQVFVGSVDRHRRWRAVFSWAHAGARGWSCGGAWAAADVTSHINRERNHSDREDGQRCQQLRDPPWNLAHPISSQHGMSAATCFAW